MNHAFINYSSAAGHLTTSVYKLFENGVTVSMADQVSVE